MKEIDVACESANTLTSLPNNPSSSRFGPLQNNCNYVSSSNNVLKKPWAYKQSTLDSFIGKGVGLENPAENPVVDDLVQQVAVEGEVERVSDVEIDAAAAKTWIYPGHIHGFFLELPSSL